MKKLSKSYYFIALILVGLALLYLLFGKRLGLHSGNMTADRMNVILISIDTLRADYVSAYGSNRALTPNLDRMASRGILFPRCISQTPLTLPSHTSILSATYPLYHQVRSNTSPVPQQLDLISEVLQKEGFRTSAFVGAYVLHRDWGLNQGFDYYSDRFDSGEGATSGDEGIERRADAVLGDARNWIAANRNETFFSFIHLYDPHSPYSAPTGFDNYPDDPYRGEVEYVDSELGKFFNYLEAEGILDHTILIITSDHGESFGEHNEPGEHGYFIYEPTVWVPLIVKAPYSLKRRQMEGYVELVDISPTILEMLGLEPPRMYQGKSFFPQLNRSKNRLKTTAYTETYFPRIYYGFSQLQALYYDNWKYISAPREELYDLADDPEETDSLHLKKSVEKARMKDRINQFIGEMSTNSLEQSEAEISRDQLRKVAALGYLTREVSSDPGEILADPKDKIAALNRYEEALALSAERQYTEASNVLLGILAEEPKMITPRLLLGDCYKNLSRYREAAVIYMEIMKSIANHAGSLDSISGLIDGLPGGAVLAETVHEIEAFFKDYPENVSLMFQLGEYYFRGENYPAALKYYSIASASDPSDTASLNRMGEISILINDYQSAEDYLERALKRDQKAKNSHYLLAQLEQARGNTKAKIEHYLKELENNPTDYRSSLNIAESYRTSDRYSDSIPYYELTIKHAPDIKIAYFMVANYFLAAKEKLERAIELCKTGIAIEPVDQLTVGGMLLLAQIYTELGHQEQADRMSRDAQRLKQSLR